MEEHIHSDPAIPTEMCFASATVTGDDYQNAGQILAEQIDEQMNDLDVDVVLAFLSPHYRAVADKFIDSLQTHLNPKLLLGCTAEGVIGRSQEIERRSAVSVIAAHLPGIDLVPFSLQSMDWEKFLTDAKTFRHIVGAPDHTKLFILLADPFTTPTKSVLNAFNRLYPTLPMIGGMASGSTRPGGNALLLDGLVLNNGAVGAAFAGDFEVDIIVSQGCRPIGDPLRVTSVEKNMIYSLDGEPPLTYLRKLLDQLSEKDRGLLQSGLYLGRAVTTAQEPLGRGDFLIRGIMGLDQENGAMIISDYINDGEVIQFHLRDASTATEDLEMMLAPQLIYDPPSGGLLFSCNGRGTRLYDRPNGDVSTIQEIVGDIELAGFFCAGEIGPIGGRNFLHGHTASLALFRPLGPLP